jgi:hypothetical protein
MRTLAPLFFPWFLSCLVPCSAAFQPRELESNALPLNNQHELIRERLLAPVIDRDLPDYVRGLDRPLDHILTLSEFVLLHDRIRFVSGSHSLLQKVVQEPAMRDLLAALKACSDFPQTSAVAKELGDQWDSRRRSSAPYMSADEALSLLQDHRDLTDPDALLRMVQNGIRFSLVSFVKNVHPSDEELRRAFPLLSNTLWQSSSGAWSLPLACASLRKSGRHEIVSVIEQFPQVIMYFDELSAQELFDEPEDNMAIDSIGGQLLLKILQKPYRQGIVLDFILESESLSEKLFARHPLHLFYEPKQPEGAAVGPVEKAFLLRLGSIIARGDVGKTLQLLGSDGRTFNAIVEGSGETPFRYADVSFLNELLNHPAAKEVFSNKRVSRDLVAAVVKAKRGDEILVLLKNAGVFPDEWTLRSRRFSSDSN